MIWELLKEECVDEEDQKCSFGYIKCEGPVFPPSWYIKYTVEFRAKRDSQTKIIYLGVISDR